MLKADHISVELGNHPVISDLSFSTDSGILVILGLNGSGKTTLLRAIAGLLKLKNGTIEIGKTNIARLSRKEIAKLISYVPQEFNSIFDFSVEEMILFGRTPFIKTFHSPGPDDYNIVKTIMQEMNIEYLKDRPYNELSGGEKRLVLISMTLAQNTGIVLFDEPTSFLDVKNSILIINKVRKLSEELNKTILISMHDINETIAIADKVLMLCGLNNYKFGDVTGMITKDNLSELYKTDFEILYNTDHRMFVLHKQNESTN